MPDRRSKMNIFAVLLVSISLASGNVLNRNDECSVLLSDAVIKEIASYGKVRDEIMRYVLEGEFKGKTYNE